MWVDCAGASAAVTLHGRDLGYFKLQVLSSCVHGVQACVGTEKRCPWVSCARPVGCLMPAGGLHNASASSPAPTEVFNHVPTPEACCQSL